MDLALASNGAQILMATSCDTRHPVSNVIDGSEKTFWASTGLYPQELVLAFAGSVQPAKLKLTMQNVKEITIEKSDSTTPTNFEKLLEAEVQDRGVGRLQVEVHNVPRTQARFLKFTIHAGWDDICAIHRIQVDGTSS